MADTFFTNYPTISEIWRVFIPHQYMKNQLLDIERKHGITALARLVQQQCHYPHQPRVKKFALLRTKVGVDNEDMYFMLWHKPEFKVDHFKPLVIRTEPGIDLYPVPVFMTGFIMGSVGFGEKDTGNRRIQLPGRDF